MPGLTQRNEQCSVGFWSNDSDGVSYNQLQKFWSELTPKARQELLRIDKQTLFEQARKNAYCSRCNGLLLEGFLQIVIYGKSLQQERSARKSSCNNKGGSKDKSDYPTAVCNGCADEMQDPSVHHWGGLTTTRDGSLTLIDYYLNTKSLKALQSVFDSARARERERELLYPDACGGGSRGWISQGMTSYGRGHGARETCALHTARLSCDTLVDFWSSLGEETQQSLWRMKEDDFIERLMHRFDSKRFCRDCRRNVICEFKELKELKRMRREPRCTSWFCGADTAFKYVVSSGSVRADWRQTFAETAGIYHHFEWAIGTGEGKSDIQEFENVGLRRLVQVNGLDLRGLNTCYITLRAFKLDGRCSEIFVKAHALNGQQCVHCRLVVGDGFVSVKKGEDIRSFFERAEEAEEEEDEDLMDKDGNELDGECSRPQKHAKSPELAREFLLEAATVIFKEQVEKAFREETARQNAHSIFVCLALKLLEQRIHVACKEIVTLEKQMKLLEEEENEKREEEERKERKRIKEREKKLRRKERMKEKERGKGRKNPESNDKSEVADTPPEEEGSPNIEEASNITCCKESVKETGDDEDGQCCNDFLPLSAENLCCETTDGDPLISEESLQADHGEDEHICADHASFVRNSEVRYGNDVSEVPSRCFTRSNGQSKVNRYSCTRESLNSNMVWEPVEVKKYSRSNSVSDITLSSSAFNAEAIECGSSVVKATERLANGSHKDQGRESGDSIDSTEEEDIMEFEVDIQSNNKWHLKEAMMISTSNSDNCSSCLSEGDGNTAFSNSGSTKSSSTSDSEDVSERRGTSSDTQKDIGDLNQVSSKVGEALGYRSSEIPFTVADHNMNIMGSGISMAPQPQGIVHQMLDQKLQFAAFQAPSAMGYYHQAPVSWPAGPVNGLMPFQPHNNYLYGGPLGYGLNEDPQLCMQYGGSLAHSPSPFFNSGSVPMFHPLDNSKRVNNAKEQVRGLEPRPLMEVTKAGGGGDDSFSLFHFGSPVALSSAAKLNPVQSKNGVLRDLACNKTEKESKVEEYNLFAANTGLRFSLF